VTATPHAHLDRGVIEVREALEETRARGVVAKAPKTAAGRRDITLPDIAVEALRVHRRRLLEMRVKLGAGKLPDDAFLFANLEGRLLRPSTISSDWGELAESIGMPEITFHGLVAAHPCEPAHRQRRRYCHDLEAARPCQAERHPCDLFTTDGSKAAAAINAALTVS
jgi:hypothetical protein